VPFITRKSLLTLTVLSGVAVAAGAGFIWSGIYNIGADDTHTRPVYALMQAMRERSIETRAHKLQLPADLSDPARITQGAGNYSAMCTGCHLGPGMEETELSKGLYPAPPNLAKEPVDAAEAFWVIKHGIKASGMPAWGKSMDDDYIWNMAAFLQQLPKLNVEQYQAMVASSGGHSHGGGETDGHAHAEGTPAHDDSPADEHAGMDMDVTDPDKKGDGTGHVDAPGTPSHHHDDASKTPAAAPTKPTVHLHADGKEHVHAPAKSMAPAVSKPKADASPSPSNGTKATPMQPTPEPAPDEHTEHEHQH